VRDAADHSAVQARNGAHYALAATYGILGLPFATALGLDGRRCVSCKNASTRLCGDRHNLTAIAMQGGVSTKTAVALNLSDLR